MGSFTEKFIVFDWKKWWGIFGILTFLIVSLTLVGVDVMFLFVIIYLYGISIMMISVIKLLIMITRLWVIPSYEGIKIRKGGGGKR